VANATRFFFISKRGTKFFLIVATFLAALVPIRAANHETGSSRPQLADRARQIFKSAQSKFRANPRDLETAIAFARATFDAAEFSHDDDEREELAKQGIDASRQALSVKSDSAAAHYYLAMNLGQLARTKKIGALKLVDEMEKEFNAARQLDSKFDYAGPDRNLGWLYFQAPGWPASIGNRTKARSHLQRAVVLQPDYPENHLDLLEAFLKWGEKSGAAREFKSVQELWPKAKKQFSGEEWDANWFDWEKRWKNLRSKFSENQRILESPHGND
jgi:hypothetical protein